MKFKFGKVIYDAADPICIQLLGKAVICSNIGNLIDNFPSKCYLGTLIEILDVNSENPFVVELKDKSKVFTSFIRGIIKVSG